MQHTAYRIASCTKSFTSAAVLSLRDSGALSLDDPITRFVPAFSAVTLPTADAPTPTIRMLLTMSAGFPTDNPWGDRQESISAAELDALLSSGLSFDTVPGTRFAYSNLGFALLGRFPAPARSPRSADCSALWRISAAGRPGWSRHLTPPPATRQPHPLSRASRRELQQLQRFDPARAAHPTGYGLGLFVEHYPRNEVVTSHSGGYPGFSAHMRWFQANGLGVIAFENATGSRVALAATEAFDRLIGAQRTGRAATRRAKPTPEVWPATRTVQAGVTELIRSWSDDAADRLCSESVALDEPFVRRRAAIDRKITKIGGLSEQASVDWTDEESVAPSHLVWHLPGQAGRLRIEVQLTPENPPRVQTLKVSADRA